jgi:hypothetical protein
MTFRAFLLLAPLAACAAAPEPAPAPPAPPAPAPAPAPAADVRLRAEPRTAAPGAAITLTLENGTAAELGYNLCASALERMAAGAWHPVPELRPCTRELRLLAPSASASLALTLPRDLPPGTYRYVTGASAMRSAGHRRVASAHFFVR